MGGTPLELWTELRDLVASLEKDAEKATRGMTAGGVRLRGKMQEARALCLDVRRAVLARRTYRRKKKKAQTAWVKLRNAARRNKRVGP